MPRFLIEVSHRPDKLACIRVAEALARTGSHFLTRAEWGCSDGIHKAWLIAEVDCRGDALAIVPPDFRLDATVVRLDRFTMDRLEELRERHGARA